MIVNILYVFLAIFMLGLIVTVHEFGHYLVGRICGIGIVEFAVGMVPASSAGSARASNTPCAPSPSAVSAPLWAKMRKATILPP
ncbi:MAG: hypothetical protein E7337_09090 [Clostridiales bacterium]|nr:hypothetical protein [Clostridiales bacterium]